MHPSDSRFHLVRGLLVLSAVLVAGAVGPAHAAVTSYTAVLNGANEATPNPSTGTGSSQVDIDPVAHTMRVQISFADLVGYTTASHIHAPTPTPLTGTAGVATTTPTFTSFPLNVYAGTYDHTYDMTQSSSYNPTFITNNGGTTATAEAALFAAIANGQSYVNIHTNLYPGGEIRGFLTPMVTPARQTTWGRVKSLYTSWQEAVAPRFQPALELGPLAGCAPTPECCAVGCCGEQETVAVAAR